jgi:threonine ammonia-lyase medium form
MPLEKVLIGLEDILAARQVIGDRLHRTPLARSNYLGEQAGVQLYFKLELFQKTGSFKPRGVLNKLHHLDPSEKQKGVITLSAGNHAQALAWAVKQIGVQATVVMPATSVRSKVEATRGYGGEVVFADGDLLATCLKLQKERDLTLVHPFDDPHIIAGHGTMGLEILEDMPEVDAVVVAVGGGGLISGIAAAIKEKKPTVKVIGVEPDGASAMTQSLQRGEPIHLERLNTIADGLAAPFAGEHTFAHVRAFVDDMVTVPDQQILAAMGLILERCKVMAEPAAAATLAGLLSGKVKLPQGARVVCVLSGGNVDRERLKTLL